MCYQCLENMKAFERQQAATVELQPQQQLVSDAEPDLPLFEGWPRDVGGEA